MIGKDFSAWSFTYTLLMDSRYIRKYAGIEAACLHQFSDPVSPHIAVRSSGSHVSLNTKCILLSWTVLS